MRLGLQHWGDPFALYDAPADIQAEVLAFELAPRWDELHPPEPEELGDAAARLVQAANIRGEGTLEAKARFLAFQVE